MPREKVDVRNLRERSIASLRRSVVAFNSLDEDGRGTTVLLHLQHAFEMLLKAGLISGGRKVFDKRSGRSISFDDALGLSQSGPPLLLTDDEAGVLRSIDSLRDSAQHWYVVVDEGILYTLVRAGVTAYDVLLRRVFTMTLAEHLPERVLPISVRPPEAIELLIDREFSQVRELLKPGRRRRQEAMGRIRTLLSLEALVDPDSREAREPDVRRVERGIKMGEARETVFPVLSLVRTSIEGEGLGVRVSFAKSGGFPVTYSDGAADPSAIRLVDLEKKFYLGATDLARKVGLTPPRATALRRHLGLGEDDDHYSHRFVFGSQKTLRYSDNAYRAMKEAKSSLDLDAVWQAHRPTGATSACSQPECSARS